MCTLSRSRVPPIQPVSACLCRFRVIGDRSTLTSSACAHLLAQSWKSTVSWLFATALLKHYADFADPSVPAVDGWQLKVTDLYNEPTLFVRSPESDAVQRHNFTDDDPYCEAQAHHILRMIAEADLLLPARLADGEISALIDAAEAGNAAAIDAAQDSAIADDDDDDTKSGIIPYAQTHEGILSSFRDACGTYALTWAIKEASERAKKTAPVDQLAEWVCSGGERPAISADLTVSAHDRDVASKATI